MADDLAHFKPKLGDSVLIKAGTVHTLGDVVVFEVQQNSDVTYRLYDWDRVDEKTGKPRPLQVEKAIACVDLEKVDITPVHPFKTEDGPELRELLIADEHFTLWRLTGDMPFMVGKHGLPRVLVNVEGSGEIDHKNTFIPLNKGDTMLLPASVGECPFVPHGKVVLLEIALPGE